MALKKMLITGFDPFGGQSVNPAWQAVGRLPDTVGEFALTKLEIPTVFGGAAQTVLDTAKTLKPDVILCVGQAGGRSAITPEYVGINLRHARIPDNGGNRPQEQPIVPGGPDGLFSTLPVHKMARAIQDAGVPGEVSYSAGTFVCNDTLYTLLHHCLGTSTRVGFIHVPFLPEQTEAGKPALPLEQILRGLSAAIEAIS